MKRFLHRSSWLLLGLVLFITACAPVAPAAQPAALATKPAASGPKIVASTSWVAAFAAAAGATDIT